MKFIKGFFITLGVFFLLMIATSITVSYFALSSKEVKTLPNNFILTMTLDAPLAEEPQLSLNFNEKKLGLHEITNTLQKIAKDDRALAIYVRLKGKDLTISQVEELRPAFEAVKASGKSLKLYTEDLQSFTNSTVVLALTSIFDEIWMQPIGGAYIPPLKLELPFAKGALDQIGVTPEFAKRGPYKNAPESFTQSEPSQESVEMMTRLTQNWDRSLVAMIKQARPETDFEALRSKIIVNAYELLDAKLIDRVGYYDEFQKDMKIFETEETQVKKVKFQDYKIVTDQKSMNSFDLNSTPKVAFLLMEGAIISPEFSETQSYKRSGLASDGTIDPLLFEKALHDIAQKTDIAAVLIRIDSPGGTPSGAETIRRAIQTVKASGKKVYISMGSAAASGGYWVALEGDMIFANPSTLTGSIGVYGGKFTLGNLMDKIGVNWFAVQSNPDLASNFYSPNFSMTEQDKLALNQSMDFIYNAFLERVSTARNIEIEKLNNEIAQGRVWTGNEAFRLGLIDQIGGFKNAVEQIKLDLGVMEDEEIILVRYPEPKSPLEELMKFFDDLMQSKASIQTLITSLRLNAQTQGKAMVMETTAGN